MTPTYFRGPKTEVQQKYIIFAELDLKSAKLGYARSKFTTNLPKTLITMKLTTKSSSGIFKKVPEFLQRSTDRFHLDSGGSLPTFSWMIWHHTGFRSLFCLFRVPSGVEWLRGGLLVRFFLFYDFRTCRVGHLECAYLIPHISNFLSKFCNIDCLTLHFFNLVFFLNVKDILKN